MKGPEGMTLQLTRVYEEPHLTPDALHIDSTSGLSQPEDASSDVLLSTTEGALSSSTEAAVSSSTEDALSSSTEDKSEGKVQKALKAETLAFQASFAQAAAADKADRPAGVDFATAGQRTEAWHNMRQGRLTASSFANALGYDHIILCGDNLQVVQLRSSVLALRWVLCLDVVYGI